MKGGKRTCSFAEKVLQSVHLHAFLLLPQRGMIDSSDQDSSVLLQLISSNIRKIWKIQLKLFRFK